MKRSLGAIVIVTTLIGGSKALQLPILNKVKDVTAGPIRLSEIGCGTWSWGNRLLWGYDTDQDAEIYQAYAIVRKAGISVFDTADSYGTADLNGRAEVLLGEFEKRYQSEKGVLDSSSTQQVATKFAPYPWRITRGSIVSAAEASLGRLQQDQLALGQLHWSTANYQPFQERSLWEGIGDVYDAGLCKAVGVSNYGPQQLRRIHQYLTDRGVPLATAQIQYSLMTYQTAREMNDVCDELGIRLIAYSPLCLGLLTGKYDEDNLPSALPRRQLFKELLPGARGLLNTLEAMALEYNKTPSQIAINWALCKNTVPIPGVRTVRQAKDTVTTTGWRLKKDAVEELDRQAFAVSKPMVQNVFQTK